MEFAAGACGTGDCAIRTEYVNSRIKRAEMSFRIAIDSPEELGIFNRRAIAMPGYWRLTATRSMPHFLFVVLDFSFEILGKLFSGRTQSFVRRRAMGGISVSHNRCVKVRNRES